MDVAGIILRDQKKVDATQKKVGPDVPVVTDIEQLNNVDVAILSIPSRAISDVAPKYLEMGINTIDSFDIHGDPVIDLRKT